MQSTPSFLGLMGVFLTCVGQLNEWRTEIDSELHLSIGTLEQLGCQVW